MLRKRVRRTVHSIVAIDADSYKIAAVISEGARHELFTAKLSGGIAARCHQAEEYVYQLLRTVRGPVAVFVETPAAYAKGGVKALLPLARVNGAILAGASRADAEQVDEVNIMVWKKEIVGKGNATKPQIRSYLRKYWRRMHDKAIAEKGFEQDLVDAACIWQYGAQTLKARKLLARNPR